MSVFLHFLCTVISHFKPTHLESAWQPRVLEGFVFFSVYNQQNGCQYKIIKTITATWELINRCTQRWLVWWTNYRVLLLLNPANKPDYTCIMPTYPSALCWVIWFCFMTIALRWGWFRLHLAQFWKKKKKPAFTNSHSHRRAFQGQRTHSAFIIQRHAAETSVSFHFSVGKAMATNSDLDYLILTKVPWNLIPSTRIVSTHLFEAQCVSAVCWLCPTYFIWCLFTVWQTQGSPSTFSQLAAQQEYLFPSLFSSSDVLSQRQWTNDWCNLVFWIWQLEHSNQSLRIEEYFTWWSAESSLTELCTFNEKHNVAAVGVDLWLVATCLCLAGVGWSREWAMPEGLHLSFGSRTRCLLDPLWATPSHRLIWQLGGDHGCRDRWAPTYPFVVLIDTKVHEQE